MGYGDSSIRKMAATKASKMFDDMFDDDDDDDSMIVPTTKGKKGATDFKPFRKAGPEFERLKQLMKKHGSNMYGLTANAICRKDPYFGKFRPNSLKCNITAIKKLFALRFPPPDKKHGGVILDDDDDGDKKPAALPVGGKEAKRATDNQLSTEKIKRQAQMAPEQVLYKPVVHQASSRDEKKIEKLIVLVTMPGHIDDTAKLVIEFGNEDGNMLSIWVPRGMASSNMEKLKAMLPLVDGVSNEDAVLFANSMEDAMMSLRTNKNAMILDCYSIELKKQCDINKAPKRCLYRSKDDGDIALLLVLDVPSKNDYAVADDSWKLMDI